MAEGAPGTGSIDGLLQTLLEQVNGIAGRAVTRQDMEELKREFNTGLGDITGKVEGIKEHCAKQTRECAARHASYDKTVEAMSKYMANGESAVEEKRKRRRDLVYKLILVATTAILTLASGIVMDKFIK